MDDGVEPPALQPVHQLSRGHEVRKLALGEIAPFAVMAEHVADGHVGAARVVQRGHDVRSDKTGATGHQQHAVPCLIVLSLSWASFAPVLRGRQLGLWGVVKTAKADFTARLYLPGRS